MARVQFQKLWDNHPYPDAPCDTTLFPNQCAIRMTVALEGAGVDTSSFDSLFPRRRCASAYPALKSHKPGHILAAQQLADWLRKQEAVVGKASVHKKVSSTDFQGKKGVVFIKNGWGATDHIDVWNGSMLKGGALDYFSRGQEVWFWELQ